MNNGRNDCQVSRRVVLTGTALVLGAAAGVTAVTQASAQRVNEVHVLKQPTLPAERFERARFIWCYGSVYWTGRFACVAT
ncbi:MAG: hypothetical protein WAK55_06195, partial [Xanthobacteraceae bacterium]